MHKKFEINRTKFKGDCQSGRKVVTHNSKSDLPLYAVNKMSLKMVGNSLYCCNRREQEKNEEDEDRNVLCVTSYLF